MQCNFLKIIVIKYFQYLAGGYSSENGAVKGEVTGRSWRTLQRGTN